MRKVLVIAGREYRAAVRTKSFLISLLFMPLLMVGSVLIQFFLEDLAQTHEKIYAVVDRTPGQGVFPVIEEAAGKRGANLPPRSVLHKGASSLFSVRRIEPSADDPDAITRQRGELSERVYEGEFAGFLEIGPDVYNHPPPEPYAEAAAGNEVVNDRAALRYQTNTPTDEGFRDWVGQVVNEAVLRRRCEKAGLAPETSKSLVRSVPLLPYGLSQRNVETNSVEDVPEEKQLALLLLPAGFAALMFLVIMVGATPLMQGVVEEKMQRVAEVLLGSVRPFELMMGKLFGMIGVSLTLTAVYFTFAYWAAYRYGLVEQVPVSLFAWFVVYQLLAGLMYGSLFLAIGSACTDMKETQILTLPVVLVICLPLFSVRYILQQPNSGFATGMSLFPLATPMLMITRQAVPPGVPWWQPAAGVLLVSAATVACVYGAGRIFRVGILMQGKGASLREMARWVWRG